MPEQPELQRTRRRLPHWKLDGSTYYVTFRLINGELSSLEITLVLNHIKSGHKRFYELFAASVMPDHVHVLMKPNTGVDLSRVVKGIKGVSARLVNESRGTRGSLWQDESWDRILRNQDELDEKLRYMLNNPVEAGLVEDPWTWPGWYLSRSDG